MFTRILVGLLLVALGILVVLYTEKFHDFFGTLNFADRWIGAGGSRLMYKFIGIIVSLVGFLYMTNLLHSFLNATVGFLIY